MKKICRNILWIMTLALSFSACGEEEGPEPVDPEVENGIINFVNPAADREVSANGETVSCVLTAEDVYTATLNFVSGGDDWASITKGETGEAGRNTVRLVFEKNDTDQPRSVEIHVQVKGHDQVQLAVFSQKQDDASAEKKLNSTLNSYMHQRLQQEYLWEQYNALEVDLSMDYKEFLSAHLLKLGDINVEDGGVYRATSPDRGKRFIYSNIQEIEPVTKAVETHSLGFGPFFSSVISPAQGVVGLSVSFVHQGSPAWAAGMKRGDTIYSVNGVTLTEDNYRSYMTALYYSPSGSYTFGFIRDADVTKRYEVSVATDVYRYNPVLYSAVMKEGSNVIGYLVLENFDLDAQEFIVDIIQQFKDNAITDLILDLRFNPGGAVAQSRYLASAIAGASHLDDIFVNVEFRGSKKQAWKFRGGPNDEDGLGIAPDLGLKRLYVIGSENTASASELIINGLRGIDFPVYLYGSRTEGKNVGMTTTLVTADERRFLFSPITFRVANARGERDYPDGFVPDVIVNNQNSNYADDDDNLFPYSFGDWPDMDFNVALRYAYEDILGIERSLVSRPMSVSETPVPLGASEYKEPKIGRYGNVIYQLD
ncbi:MAG: peptidase S41 [Bacteroidales bacterium]|nr:peptidase S41 [Bacteroidales bacterium]